MITILGLGPGPADLLSRRAWAALQHANALHLRTLRHPCVADLPAHLHCYSFDHLYESIDDFDEVYAAIVAHLMDLARQGKDVIYAVPGDPLVGESTVTRLLAAAQSESIQCDIINGISFIEPCLKALGIDALNGIQILDALEVATLYHPPINPSQPALLAQVYSRAVASDLKLTLMNQYPDDFPVELIHGAGTSDIATEALPLYEIDRVHRIDAMTTLYLPPLHPLSSFEAFQNIIAQLRSPEGCPWDREQTHQSLRSFLIEEAYETLEALEDGDVSLLCEELGDLLLQILLHAQIASEDGSFAMRDILRGINEKMIRRHPHVWGDVDVRGDSAIATQNWEAIRRAEKADSQRDESLLDGLPKAMPALLVAQRYSQRASTVGFDWDDVSGVEQKAREEIAEVFAAETVEDRIHEIGDLIFVLVNWLRWLRVDDPESLLREINAKFYRRFAFVEGKAASESCALSDCSLDQLDAFWQAAKRAGL